MMAMDKDALGAALAEVLVSSSNPPPTGDQLANITKFWTGIAEAFITHMQDNAEVPPGISVNAGGYTGSTTGTGGIR
jgi:hypothetical protein